jgi:hypothetical protein
MVSDFEESAKETGVVLPRPASADRRRPGRRDAVAQQLVPLLRLRPAIPEIDRGHGSQKLARAVRSALVVLVLSLIFWCALFFAVRRLFNL